MTKEELLTELTRLAQVGDEEVAHGAADRALLEFINDPQITEAFDAIDKWYA